uniref:Uncharacterized protein n=1 Tax=Anguilla anguilla TaxID=7936 RepID=A0A0E9RGT0_ANGAN
MELFKVFNGLIIKSWKHGYSNYAWSCLKWCDRM